MLPKLLFDTLTAVMVMLYHQGGITQVKKIWNRSSSKSVCYRIYYVIIMNANNSGNVINKSEWSCDLTKLGRLKPKAKVEILMQSYTNG